MKAAPAETSLINVLENKSLAVVAREGTLEFPIRAGNIHVSNSVPLLPHGGALEQGSGQVTQSAETG